MNGEAVKAYLREICRRLDEGRPLSRFALRRVLFKAATPAVMSLALGASGCGFVSQGPAPTEGDAFVEMCSDDEDNDGNGDVDCGDEACADHSLCLPGQDPVIMPEEQCADGEDNDGNGVVDCDDEACLDHPSCIAEPPAQEELCDDGEDNDGDGWVDCADADCGCMVALYMAPMPEEDCHDGQDNDKDGKVDCDDADCLCAVALYMAPMAEGDCHDGQDNDGDSQVDCEDSDCDDSLWCQAVAEYAAPFE